MTISSNVSKNLKELSLNKIYEANSNYKDPSEVLMDTVKTLTKHNKTKQKQAFAIFSKLLKLVRNELVSEEEKMKMLDGIILSLAKADMTVEDYFMIKNIAVCAKTLLKDGNIHTKTLNSSVKEFEKDTQNLTEYISVYFYDKEAKKILKKTVQENNNGKTK